MSDLLNMQASDRGILVGANGTGKSTLANHIIGQFRRDYPHARIAILDTKPRWRAGRRADGTSPIRMYKPLAKGDTIPGSVSLSKMADWQLAWDKDTNPSRTVIVQNLDLSEAANVRFQTAFAQKFFTTQYADTPSLLYLDEGMDFFYGSTAARGGSDIIQRCFRAGRERGLATLIAVQRPSGINLQCLTETNYCALFRINYRGDVMKLWDMGFPQNVDAPSYADQRAYGPGLFRLWREGTEHAPLVRLDKKEHRQHESVSKSA